MSKPKPLFSASRGGISGLNQKPETVYLTVALPTSVVEVIDSHAAKLRSTVGFAPTRAQIVEKLVTDGLAYLK